jgi:hypothetical protein
MMAELKPECICTDYIMGHGRFNPCCWKKFATQMSAGRNSLCCLKPGPESLSLREQDMKQRNGQTEGERQPLKHKQKKSEESIEGAGR